MSRRSRDKGSRGELLWRDWLRAFGCKDASRAARNGVRRAEDVLDGIPGTKCEVKFVEKLNVRAAMRQACCGCSLDTVPYVAHKTSREDWLVTVRADDLARFAERLASVTGRPIYPPFSEDRFETPQTHPASPVSAEKQ